MNISVMRVMNYGTMEDDKFADFAADELAKIDIIDKKDLLDHVVIRMPKTYPAYFGTYDRFDELRAFADKIENLFMVGRMVCTDTTIRIILCFPLLLLLRTL